MAFLTNKKPIPPAGTFPGECDGLCDAKGRCVKSHPIHCCHLMSNVFDSYPKVYAECQKGCGKRTVMTKVEAPVL